MYAVIESGGKQHRVELGTEIQVDRLDAQPGDSITLERVLLIADGDETAIGQPVVDGATVSAEVLGQDRGRKIVVFKYKPKARTRVKKGFRAELTTLRITEIAFGDKSAAKDAEKQRKAEAKQAKEAEKEAREAAAKAAEEKAAADAELAAKLAAAAEASTKDSAEAKPKTTRKTTARKAPDEPAADAATPAEEAAPADAATPAEEAAPADAATPAEEAAPADAAAPAEEAEPAPDTTTDRDAATQKDE
jgi:large subunit ribosomal protein L21